MPLFVAIISCFLAEKVYEHENNDELGNIKKFFGFVKQPQLYKPIIFILIFMMTPSCTNVMFYFYTNVLKF